ncbi:MULTISPECIES: hypothetical protein [Terrabacteria group]|uniref:hypothetical protein n=1 Tax=Bacillati TaxID=1783272 RepID=UPI001C6E467B|nr:MULTISPECIES: hypothetical protein [Terrabacteria group]MBW9212464.1 hypothetical protein [Trueperella sp. zg.1013]
MKAWYSVYDVLKVPLEALLLSLLLSGLSNVLMNSYYGINVLFQSEYIFALGTLLMQIARFVLVNFPFIVLLAFAYKKGDGIEVTVSYISYIVGTLVAPSFSLPNYAYANLFDIHRLTITSSSLRYPLQTGLIGVLLVMAVYSFIQRTERTNIIGVDMKSLLKMAILFSVIGVGVGFIWPFLVKEMEHVNTYIAVDTNNPFRMSLYGFLDRVLQTVHLGALIRQPFWYGLNGGSWVNLAGGVIKGDAYIWTAQMSVDQTTALAGHFFTPFYALNLIIIPSLIWTFFSLETNRVKRKKMIKVYLVLTMTSWLAGISLPIQLVLLFLSPLLFIFYVGMNGLLYGVLQITQIRLGYLTNEANTIISMPGTLTEYLYYFSKPFLYQSLIWILVIGVGFSILYILATRFYFKHMALDIFFSGKRKRMVHDVLMALGGVSNIRQLDSNIYSLTVRLYDSGLLDVALLRNTGCMKVCHSSYGEELSFGACSTILRMDILKEIRSQPEA